MNALDAMDAAAMALAAVAAVSCDIIASPITPTLHKPNSERWEDKPAQAWIGGQR